MRHITLHIPIYFPERLYRFLASAKKRFKRSETAAPESSTLNLNGDRDIEWSWIGSQMPDGPGEALDFGPGRSFMALLAAERGFRVTGVDLTITEYPYTHPNLSFVNDDLLELGFSENRFDLILNCSTVEHVGLAGRYGVTKIRKDGDLEAMELLHRLLKPEGSMLLTIPVGKDAIFPPICRVYGIERLPLLLEHYQIEKEIYWIKNSENKWEKTDKEMALHFKALAGSWDAMQNIYALGCFVLRPC
jgi:2-polyprenyl-3-methyl-5-hydroxy-6-metoxy-1,4-benzoquinol methylase